MDNDPDTYQWAAVPDDESGRKPRHNRNDDRHGPDGIWRDGSGHRCDVWLLVPDFIDWRVILGSRQNNRRLNRYKRRKDNARTSHQFLIWSIRFHRLRNRLFGPPTLWSQ